MIGGQNDALYHNNQRQDYEKMLLNSWAIGLEPWRSATRPVAKKTDAGHQELWNNKEIRPRTNTRTMQQTKHSGGWKRCLAIDSVWRDIEWFEGQNKTIPTKKFCGDKQTDRLNIQLYSVPFNKK